MIIKTLEYREPIGRTDEIEGGVLPPVIAPFASIGVFTFDSLVVGRSGSFGGGTVNILTTASPGAGYAVGFAFQYTSVAIGEV